MVVHEPSPGLGRFAAVLMDGGLDLARVAAQTDEPVARVRAGLVAYALLVAAYAAGPAPAPGAAPPAAPLLAVSGPLGAGQGRIPMHLRAPVVAAP